MVGNRLNGRMVEIRRRLKRLDKKICIRDYGHSRARSGDQVIAVLVATIERVYRDKAVRAWLVLDDYGNTVAGPGAYGTALALDKAKYTTITMRLRPK